MLVSSHIVERKTISALAGLLFVLQKAVSVCQSEAPQKKKTSGWCDTAAVCIESIREHTRKVWRIGHKQPHKAGIKFTENGLCIEKRLSLTFRMKSYTHVKDLGDSKQRSRSLRRHSCHFRPAVVMIVLLLISTAAASEPGESVQAPAGGWTVPSSGMERAASWWPRPPC